MIIISYAEKSRELTDKVLEFIRWTGKIAEYKLKIQKSIDFLYPRKKYLEGISFEKVPLKVAAEINVSSKKKSSKR